MSLKGLAGFIEEGGLKWSYWTKQITYVSSQTGYIIHQVTHKSVVPSEEEQWQYSSDYSITRLIFLLAYISYKVTTDFHIYLDIFTWTEIWLGLLNSVYVFRCDIHLLNLLCLSALSSNMTLNGRPCCRINIFVIMATFSISACAPQWLMFTLLLVPPAVVFVSCPLSPFYSFVTFSSYGHVFNSCWWPECNIFQLGTCPVNWLDFRVIYIQFYLFNGDLSPCFNAVVF